ncbi:MAG: RnfABCDGE type electron transport complex subunit G [Bacteroidales bacterium]|nr:RnfABCDGE type electron transport complex subunit G [Bacteroidales bacterium]
MAKKESSLKNMIISLVVISFVASLALGGIYNLTKEPIELAIKAKQVSAIKEVLPEFDTLVSLKAMPDNGTDSLTFHYAYKGDSLVGTAIGTYSNLGYNATQIQLMVGILPNSAINNISVVQQNETPGLGTKMKEPKFKDQFNGKKPGEFSLKVKKDGGQVDAITAATISSRAFCEAVDRACQTYQKKGER